MGYRRADGRVGTRNEIWILCTVGCVGRTAERIARLAAERCTDRVDGVYAFPHPFGCSQLGGDLERTRKLIAALARHPNAGGVLILGLGCESNQLEPLLAGNSTSRSASTSARSRRRPTADEVEEGLRLVEELVDIAARAEREPCPIASLAIGLKCGGSDGFSGITANPLVGASPIASPSAGGTAILTEIPEIFGAERLLMARAADEQVFEGIVGLVNDFKRYFLAQRPAGARESLARQHRRRHHDARGEIARRRAEGRPCHGRRRCCAMASGWSGPGLALLEAPGNDAVSSTALVAAGATICCSRPGAARRSASRCRR